MQVKKTSQLNGKERIKMTKYLILISFLALTSCGTVTEVKDNLKTEQNVKTQETVAVDKDTYMVCVWQIKDVNKKTIIFDTEMFIRIQENGNLQYYIIDIYNDKMADYDIVMNYDENTGNFVHNYERFARLTGDHAYFLNENNASLSVFNLKEKVFAYRTLGGKDTILKFNSCEISTKEVYESISNKYNK